MTGEKPHFDIDRGISPICEMDLGPHALISRCEDVYVSVLVSGC